MFGFGMPELIMVAEIVAIIVFGMVLKSKGGSTFGNITMALVGIGMIVFASTCFKDIPLIGTVFLMPGDNILDAKMSDPLLRYALFLIGGAFTAFGSFLQVRIGFSNALEETSQPSVPKRSVNSNVINFSRIKEAKELLDSGAISGEEFNTIKAKFIRQA